MAKVNIDWYISSLYIKSGNHSNIRRYLMKAGIVQVKDLCKMKEEELTKIQAKYDKVAAKLEQLQEQKRSCEAKQIMDAYIKSGKSLDEVMTFLNP